MTELDLDGFQPQMPIQTVTSLSKERIYTAPQYPLDELLGGKDTVKRLIVDTLRDSQIPTFSGFNAYLYEVSQPLTESQEGTLGQQLGRIVGKTLLVRIAQPESSSVLPAGSMTKSRMLEQEARLYGNSAIAAFTAATSSFVEYEPGKKAFLVERLPTYLVWPTNEVQMTKRLNREDVARIAWQFAMVYESIHGQIESPSDMKSLAYDDVSGRIICFDLGSTRTYYLGGTIKGVEQATMMFKDIERFGENLREFVLKYVSPDILNSISLGDGQTLADIQSICRSHANRSLWQIAQRIDRAFEGKFGKEYERIVGHPPVNISHTSLTRDIQEADWLEAKEQLDHQAAVALQKKQAQEMKEQKINIVGPDLPFDPAEYPNVDLATGWRILISLIDLEIGVNRILRGTSVQEAIMKMKERLDFLSKRNMLYEGAITTFHLVSKKSGRTFLEELLQKYAETGELTETSEGGTNGA